MDKKIKIEEFIDFYKERKINNFSWYICRRSSFVRVRIDGDLVYRTLYLSSNYLNDEFIKFLKEKIKNKKLMCNNLYHEPESENKIHFYVKEKMKFEDDKTLITDYGDKFRDVPAEDIDINILEEFIGRLN